MILVLDNYDSFTYNLVHYIGDSGEEVLVVRNDEITIEQIDHDIDENENGRDHERTSHHHGQITSL